MNVRLLAAIAGLAIVLAASGSGGTAAEPQAPAYGIVGAIAGAQTVGRVDPVTLKPLAGGLAFGKDLNFGGRSPDGRSAVFFDYRRPSLRVIDLEGLKNRGDVVLGPSGWRARAAAWLTADRVAVVIQRMRGSYSQIVDRREVVIVDPFERLVLTRHEIAVSTALTASASGGDKLVLLLGRGDARTRTVRVVVVNSSGAARTIKLDLGAPKGLRLPSLAVEPSGRRAFVVATGTPVFEIDLDTLAATPHILARAGAVFADSPLGSRQAVLLEDGTLAVSGHNTRRERGIEITNPAGLAFINTTTWQARVVDREVSGVSVSGDTLVGYSFRIERVQRGGQPAQKVTGIGLRAYAPDGTRRWQRYANQPLTAYAFRQSALVYRQAFALGSGSSFVIDLANGHQIRTNTGAQQNVWLLPDVPGARPIRAPAAATAEALQVEGGGEEFRGTVQPEVTRVVAALVDGSERELTIEAGAVNYRAGTPDESARTVQAFAGDQLVASISLRVACGGSAGPCASAEPMPGATFAILRTASGTSLAEIDPKTLAPLPARSVAIGSTSAHELSADGSLAAVGGYGNATVRVFSTATFDPAARSTLVAPLAPGNASVRALEWLAPNRLVAVVQRYKRRDRRAVSARELVVLDPQTHHVVRRTALPIGRAIVDVQASGGRLVAILRSSNHRGTGITLVAANAEGRVRTREIRLRENDGVLPETRLTLERGGKRAFLFAWRPQGMAGPLPLREIDLDSLTATERAVTITEERFYRPSGFMAWAQPFGDSAILISGAFVPLLRDGKHVPPAGIFILDTRTFKISQLDARANAFVIADDRAYTFGSTALLSAKPPRGIGVAAYDTSGSRLYHGFGTRSFRRLVAAGGYGHLLRGDRSSGVAFELASGRSLGTSAVSNAEIEVLEPTAPASNPNPLSRLCGGTSGPCPSTVRPSTSEAAPAASIGAPSPKAVPGVNGSSSARGYMVSNRGREVKPNQRSENLFQGHPFKLFLLGVVNDRAFYRVEVTSRYTCWASGNGARIGDVGTLGCPNVVGAYPIQNEDTALRMRPDEPLQRRYFRINGVAVDQAAAIALIDGDGKHVLTAPVENNLYSFSPPFPTTPVRVVALDAQGKVLKPHPEWGERQTPPANLFGPRAIQVPQPKLTEPTQRGAARGVEVTVGSNGVVVFNGTAIEPTARKLLSGRQIGINCFVLSANHRQTRSAGISAAWQPKIAFKSLGYIKPPFDGCEFQGSYGHRWRDQYGTHSAVEIALTPRADRYFANRAAARDLALFVRSRTTQQIRKKLGPELIAALRSQYGDAVVVLPSKTARAPVGVLGVWASGASTVFSEQSSAAVRYVVELKNGKIITETVRGLAFVF
jgi:hypothetical protein